MYSKSKTAENILEIIGYMLLKKNAPSGIREIAKNLNMNTSTVQRIVNTLNSAKYLSQDSENKQYVLGLKFLEISKVILDGMDLRKISQAYLKELRDLTQETVHLMILDDTSGVYVESLESPQRNRVAASIGTREDLHYSAIGKAILAHLPDNELERIIKTRGLKRMTNKTITDFNILKKELIKIKHQGYSIDNEEGEKGTRCIGAPIFRHNGKVNLSISLSAPNFRLTKNKVKQFTPLVLKAAKNISRELGHLK